jgi:hypothetical protein
MVGKMSMGLDLEILLKFPNVAREPGAHGWKCEYGS